jgi:hypothetical protein
MTLAFTIMIVGGFLYVILDSILYRPVRKDRIRQIPPEDWQSGIGVKK